MPSWQPVRKATRSARGLVWMTHWWMLSRILHRAWRSGHSIDPMTDDGLLCMQEAAFKKALRNSWATLGRSLHSG